ncbi:MAG: 3-dehydroquinate synthase [Atopobiaceae bacterium]|nr:3-dehydroquinate synthase [Atopobiaceae bacterium]
MSGLAPLSRQWIPIPGGSCDVRMGDGALEQGSKVFRNSVGTPGRCVAVVRRDEDAALLEELRRQLVDASYDVHMHYVEGDAIRTLDEAVRLFESFASVHATSDDLCVALGDADVASLAAYAACSWCGGMQLTVVPTDEIALLEGAFAPRGLMVAGHDDMVSVKPYARHVLLDYEVACSVLESETSCYARALAVSAAMCGSERVFSELWDRADLLMGGDEDALAKQLMATAKARGQAMSSTAAAIRQSVGYGQNIARAIARVAPQEFAASTLLAEGMRFAARLAVGLEKLSIDDMLAQDELLQTLGLGTLRCDIESQALFSALKEERFLRTNRFMLLVPLAIGRVRMTSVDDDLLQEHVSAWCAAHAGT